MSSDSATHFRCRVCDDSGLVRYRLTIGSSRNMPWTKACRCGHGDRYESFMERISPESFAMASERRKAA